MAFVEVAANSDSGAYQIYNSLKFNGANQYLSRTPSSAGNRRTFTYSGWIKPKPLLALNHLTIPLVISIVLF